MKNSTKWVILAVTGAVGLLVVGAGVGLLLWWRHSSGSLPVVTAAAPAMDVDRWSEVLSRPAVVKVIKMNPTPLMAGEGKESWTQVPDLFQRNTTMIHIPARRSDGIAEYEVTAEGYVFLACNYDYQGNRTGGWVEERWNPKDFTDHGWEVVNPAELGGPLVKGGQRTQVLFMKKVAAGDHGRLRCNKYDPPYFITVERGGRN